MKSGLERFIGRAFLYKKSSKNQSSIQKFEFKFFFTKTKFFL